jgi:hypothetical protein
VVVVLAAVRRLPYAAKRRAQARVSPGITGREIIMQGIWSGAVENTAEDTSVQMPTWVRWVGIVCIVTAAALVWLMFRHEKPDTTDIVLALMGIGALLVFRWVRLSLTKLKVGALEFERAVSDQEVLRAGLEKRVRELERRLRDIPADEPLAGTTDEPGPGAKASAAELDAERARRKRDEQISALERILRERGNFMSTSRARRHPRAPVACLRAGRDRSRRG